MRKSTSYNSPATKEDVEKINFLMAAVILVLMVGLVGALLSAAAILFDAFQFKSSSFQNLSNQIIVQNTKIDLLINTQYERKGNDLRPR